MNKKRNALLVLLAIAILLPSTVYAYANAPEKGSDGVWGYVASGRDASIVVGENVSDERIMVEMVESPEDGWIVVHLNDNGKPGMRVGLARIEAGISRMVEVKLEGMVEGKLIVAVHADRGTPYEFDFDMDDMMGSPDRPFFVGGSEVAEVVSIKPFGVVAEEGQAMISAGASGMPALDGTTLTIDNATTPEGAWIVVHLNDGGMPGRRVGLQYIPAGENKNITVALDPLANLSGSVIAAIHADRGDQGVYEFDMMDKVMSPDQPYFVNGKEVATVIDTKPFGVIAGEGEAAISAEPAVAGAPVLSGKTLTIGSATTPEGAWVVVHLNDGGMPGRRVGLQYIPAGENRNVRVALDAAADLSGGLIAAIHADRGTLGTFEFDMMNKFESPDQPYFVNGKEVATMIDVK